MPTPRQLRDVKDFNNLPDFVVHEVIELPDTDDEVDAEEEARKRIALRKEPNQPIAINSVVQTKSLIVDPEDDFEPQNREEREWKRKHDATRYKNGNGNTNNIGGRLI